MNEDIEATNGLFSFSTEGYVVDNIDYL